MQSWLLSAYEDLSDCSATFLLHNIDFQSLPDISVPDLDTPVGHVTLTLSNIKVRGLFEVVCIGMLQFLGSPRRRQGWPSHQLV